MHPMLNIAIQAIRKAGNFVIKQYELFYKKNTQINYINQFISKLHTESNKIIIDIIQKFHPAHIIINSYNDYYGINNNCQNDIYWIIGSIDNNINFIKQFPFFSLSIAVKIKEHIEIGVIYDPIHNELFSACRGKGAQLNGYRMRMYNTVKNTKYHNIVVAISFAIPKKYIAINFLNKFNIQNTNIDFRRTGAISLDLAYVASGRVDGCFLFFSKKKKNQLLIASGTLIIQESGGLITDVNSTDNRLSSDIIIAAHPKTITKILSFIQ